MATISPTAAAKRWNKSKTTIYKMMNDGELSFTLNEKGKRVLDVSELVRVLKEPERTPQTSINEMQEQIQRQNEKMMAIMQARIDEQAEHIKSLTGAVERFSLQLEHKQPAPEKEAEHIKQVEPIEPIQVQQPAKRRRSFFQRVLSAAIED